MFVVIGFFPRVSAPPNHYDYRISYLAKIRKHCPQKSVPILLLFIYIFVLDHTTAISAEEKMM